jgi:hypothetical protein
MRKTRFVFFGLASLLHTRHTDTDLLSFQLSISTKSIRQLVFSLATRVNSDLGSLISTSQSSQDADNPSRTLLTFDRRSL